MKPKAEDHLGLVHLCANRFRNRGIAYEDQAAVVGGSEDGPHEGGDGGVVIVGDVLEKFVGGVFEAAFFKECR